jgi:signal transduction histidine kinase
MKKAFAENHTLHSFLYGLPSDIAIENFHIQNELPVVIVNMDEKLLRQIITNLITNAIKYSDQNSVIEFRVTVNSNVSSPNVSPNVSFVISDRGIGIPEEDLEHLFSAFHRGKNVGILPGTGLGLSIVKNCIDIHNGSITVNSKLNVGTEFTVTLPI